MMKIIIYKNEKLKKDIIITSMLIFCILIAKYHIILSILIFIIINILEIYNKEQKK